jgi:hypothetical protein
MQQQHALPMLPFGTSFFTSSYLLEGGDVEEEVVGGLDREEADEPERSLHTQMNPRTIPSYTR